MLGPYLLTLWHGFRIWGKLLCSLLFLTRDELSYLFFKYFFGCNKINAITFFHVFSQHNAKSKQRKAVQKVVHAHNQGMFSGNLTFSASYNAFDTQK